MKSEVGCRATYPCAPSRRRKPRGKRDRVRRAGTEDQDRVIGQVGIGDPEKVKEVQMQLLRQGDERYGKSAPPLRQRARQAHINVSDLKMGEAVSKQADGK